jgi:hypothetical protein
MTISEKTTVEQKTESIPPKSPIPTALGYALLESVVEGSIVEKLAQIAAVGAALAGEDESKANERYRKSLRLWWKGRTPRPGPLSVFMERLRRGMLDGFRRAAGTKIAPEILDKRLNAATGPFIVMAAGHVSATPDAIEQELLDFSENLDQFGAAFASAAEANDLDRAKEVLCQRRNWLDDAYWSFPEPGLEDPHLNREAVIAASDWATLARASTPLVINTTLSWLSRLDLASVKESSGAVARFPIFLPLAARFTQPATARIAAGLELEKGDWDINLGLPVPNLIKMLKNIASEINIKLKKRSNPPKSKNISLPDREKLSRDLAEFGRHDLLSAEHFESLLRTLSPDAEPLPEEASGVNIYALLLATNLFSLLTGRDGALPTNSSRRNRPLSITITDVIPKVYEGWWRRHVKERGVDVIQRPPPQWFSNSLRG